MKIILLKTWISNIGNGFIDKGARLCLEKAFPNAEIMEVSGFPNQTVMQSGVKFFARYIGERSGKLGRPLVEFGKKRMENAPEVNNVLNIGEMIDADLAVLSGCILDIHLEWYMKTLKKIRDKEIPLILLGAGGLNYDPETQRGVRDCLKKLKTRALLTRDSIAYKCYSDYFETSYDGIDCGFFINDWYTPPKSEEEFVVATFDKTKEPKIDTDYKIIRAHHESFNSPFSGFMTAIGLILILRARLKSVNFFKKPNFFVSDSLKDYLFLYYNAIETHSDRVHACVATLAYGNSARFYYGTTRAGLFDKVVDRDIRKEVVTIDKDKLKIEKEKQILALREAIKEIV
jgi:hypothetical protein